MKRTLRNLTLFSVIILTGLSCGGRERINVLLILVDTVRADHFGCYGYERDTTPCIDSLARAGTLALNCYGQSSWTLPAMTTILSGTTPVEHGAGRREGIFYGVSPRLPWLPHSFHSEGYRTSAFFNVMFMNEDFGFHRGFEHFDCQGVASGNSLRKAGPTVDDFLSWLDSTDPDKPFFSAVHFYDPHIPYSPPSPWNALYTDPGYEGEYGETWGTGIAEMNRVNSGETVPAEADLQNLMALYDGEIRYTDHEIGRMLSELRERGYGENTLIILVGDHGEEFLEHSGIEHGRTLYQEITGVPMILAGPGFTGGTTITAPTAQLDVAFTAAMAAGIDFPMGEYSRNLATEIASRDIPASGVLWREQGDLVSVVREGIKLIWSVEDDSLECYDLANDPLEKNIIDHDSDLFNAAGYYRATPAVVTAQRIDYGESVARELRNLGYIR